MKMFPLRLLSVNKILSNFRTSAVSLSIPSISVPLSALEILNERQASHVDTSELLIDAYANTQATKVGLIEIQAGLFKQNNSFKSDPLVITLQRPQSMRRPRNIIERFANRIANHAGNNYVNFSTVCHRRSVSPVRFHRYVCPSSGYVVVHNCTNKVGVLTTECPRYQASCSNLTDTNQNACEVVSFSRNWTVCNCTLPPSVSVPARRKLTSDSSNEAETTSLQSVATGSYLVDQVVHTLSAAPSLTSADAFEHVYIVISMFASLWAVGIMLTLLVRWRKVETSAVKVGTEQRNDLNIQEGYKEMKLTMETYISEIIPVLFRGESNSFRTLREVFSHHKYTSVFFSEVTVLTIVKIITVQSMLMFLLAFTYDLQSPSDDGSCSQWQSAESCTARKSYLDSSQTYCQWSLISTDDMGSDTSNYSCSYQDSTLTVQEVLSISVIVSVVTAVFLRPIEYLFKVLNSPESNRVKIRPSQSGLSRSNVGGESNDHGKLLVPPKGY